MKIKLYGDKELDTGTLSDKESDLHEALNNLYVVCKKYDVTSFATIVLSKDRYVQSRTTTHHLKEQVQIDEYNTVFSSIDKFLQESTEGKVKITVEN